MFPPLGDALFILGGSAFEALITWKSYLRTMWGTKRRNKKSVNVCLKHEKISIFCKTSLSICLLLNQQPKKITHQDKQHWPSRGPTCPPCTQPAAAAALTTGMLLTQRVMLEPTLTFPPMAKKQDDQDFE